MFSATEVLTQEFRQWERTVKRKGAQCTSCGALHWEPLFKMCRPCRALHAVQLANWRDSQKRQKLCVHCVQAQDAGSIAMCEYHLEYHNQICRKSYRRQKRLGLCRYAACTTPPEPGYVVCQKHREAQTASLRNRRQAQRAA